MRINRYNRLYGKIGECVRGALVSPYQMLEHETAPMHWNQQEQNCHETVNSLCCRYRRCGGRIWKCFLNQALTKNATAEPSIDHPVPIDILEDYGCCFLSGHLYRRFKDIRTRLLSLFQPEFCSIAESIST